MSENIREKILNTGKEMFSSSGYKNTTMRDIANRAEMAKSSVYHYFKSKEQIFREIVMEEAKAFRLALMKSVEQANDPRQKILNYVKTRMEIIPRFVNFYYILVNQEILPLQFVKKLIRVYRLEEIRLFKNILREGVEKNQFKVPDIDLAATGIIMAVKGMESAIIQNREKRFFEKQIRDVIDVILFGIVRSPNGIA